MPSGRQESPNPPGCHDRPVAVLSGRITAKPYLCWRRFAGRGAFKENVSPVGLMNAADSNYRKFERRRLSLQIRQILTLDEQPDRPAHSGSPFDQAFGFPSEDHLMHGRRGNAKITFHICLCWSSSVDLGVVVDKREVLTLFIGVGLRRHLPILRDDVGEACGSQRNTIPIPDSEWYVVRK